MVVGVLIGVNVGVAVDEIASIGVHVAVGVFVMVDEIASIGAIVTDSVTSTLDSGGRLGLVVASTVDELIDGVAVGNSIIIGVSISVVLTLVAIAITVCVAVGVVVGTGVAEGKTVGVSSCAHKICEVINYTTTNKIRRSIYDSLQSNAQNQQAGKDIRDFGFVKKPELYYLLACELYILLSIIKLFTYHLFILDLLSWIEQQ